MSSFKESCLRPQETTYKPRKIELYEDPTNPEAITTFWQDFIREIVGYTNEEGKQRVIEARKKAEEEKKPHLKIPDWENLETPLVFKCPYTPENLKTIDSYCFTVVPNLGLSYGELGKIFSKTDYEPRNQTGPLKEEFAYREEAGWGIVELAENALNLDTSETEIAVLYKKAGLEFEQLGLYLPSAHAIKKLTGRFPDQTTMARINVAGHTAAVSFHPEGRLGIARRFPPTVHLPGLGARFQASKPVI